MEETNLERTLYTVNDDKTITINGWLEERDNNWDGFYDDPMPRIVLVTGDWPIVYDPTKEITSWACPYQQYNDDMHYDEAIPFIDDYNGTHLPMYNVDLNTPAGDYWCCFNEETRMSVPYGDRGELFTVMYANESWGEYGWGVDLEDYAIVFHRTIGNTRIWVGKTCDPTRNWLCEVEVGPKSVGHWCDVTPYDALLGGLVDAVSSMAVKEMWDEPRQNGLNYCCEDVVNAMAVHGTQAMYYGYETLPKLFPHPQEGTRASTRMTDMYRDMIGKAVEYCRANADELGIEFEDVWS